MANLLLAQSTARQRELAIRLSLGASRWLVARQLLIESLLLSFIGAAAGVLLASGAAARSSQLISTRTAIVSLDLAIDWRVLGFTTLVGVVTGLLFGVAPALRATGPDARRRAARSLARRRVGRRTHQPRARPGRAAGRDLVRAGARRQPLRAHAGRSHLAEHGLRQRPRAHRAASICGAPASPTRSGRRCSRGCAMPSRAAPGVEAAAVSVVTPMSNSVWNNLITVPGYDAPERDRSRALQSRHARLFPGDGHADPRRPRRQRVRSAGRAERRPRQRDVREKIFQRPEPARQDVHDRRDRAATSTTVEIVGLVADAKYNSLREPPPPTMYAAWGAGRDRLVGGARQPARPRLGQRVSRDGARARCRA